MKKPMIAKAMTIVGLGIISLTAVLFFLQVPNMNGGGDLMTLTGQAVISGIAGLLLMAGGEVLSDLRAIRRSLAPHAAEDVAASDRYRARPEEEAASKNGTWWR